MGQARLILHWRWSGPVCRCANLAISVPASGTGLDLPLTLEWLALDSEGQLSTAIRRRQRLVDPSSCPVAVDCCRSSRRLAPVTGPSAHLLAAPDRPLNQLQNRLRSNA
jgi:hypothetical protein